jgi:L-fuculose-phosphate aldolase
MMVKAAERRRVVAAARRMHELGLVAGSVGNVSARVGERVLITPTAVPYARLRPHRLVVLDASTGTVRSHGTPSREAPLHLAIYAQRPDLRAVVHTHSPHATAWSFLGEPLVPPLEELDYYGIGLVRTTRYAAPGTPALARAAAHALRDAKAALLGHHGVVAAGASVAEALAIAEVVEHQAHVALLLRGARAASGGGVDEHLDAAGGRRGQFPQHLIRAGQRDLRAHELGRVQSP